MRFLWNVRCHRKRVAVWLIYRRCAQRLNPPVAFKKPRILSWRGPLSLTKGAEAISFPKGVRPGDGFGPRSACPSP